MMHARRRNDTEVIVVSTGPNPGLGPRHYHPQTVTVIESDHHRRGIGRTQETVVVSHTNGVGPMNGGSTVVVVEEHGRRRRF